MEVSTMPAAIPADTRVNRGDIGGRNARRMRAAAHARKGFNPRHVWLCAIFALLTALVPVVRACYRVELNYNEGWNVYNAAFVVQHRTLYPVRYDWVLTDYPMLSFEIVAALHRMTHEYLFTSRALSLFGLVGSSVLVGAIVRRLGGTRQSALLAGFFCLALFATNADAYMGIDDPEMFAEPFFLGGLLLYLGGRDSILRIGGAALLCVVGGSIKHTPIDFPLAILLDLMLIAPWRAAWFALCGLGFASLSIWCHLHFGGPYFLAQLLAHRDWMAWKAARDLMLVVGPVLLPFGVAAVTGWRLRADRRRRIAAIQLAVSVAIGGYFGGGHGVSINALFSALFGISVLLGLNWSEPPQGGWRLAGRPLLLFGWLLIPWMLVPGIVSGEWNPAARLRALPAAERRFDQETALLRARTNGPVLCESLLRCYFGGKPYIYDGFNATRLISMHKLDAQPMLEDLRQQRYAAVQFDEPIEQERQSERWDPAIIAAIEANYVPAMANADGEIYVPAVPGKP
jgi:hypothetical protein